MRLHPQWLLAIPLTAILAAPASAQPVAIVNPGFEASPAPAGGFPVFIPAGWSLFDPQGIVDQGRNAVGVLNPAGTTFFTDPVPEGANVALIYLEQRAGTTLAGDPVGLSQVLGASLQAQTAYSLTVSVGNIASGTGLGAFASFGPADLSGFPGYRVELLAGGTVLAADDNSLAGQIPEGAFRTASVSFATGAAHPLLGQALGIRLINLNAFGNQNERGREVDFDNVALVAAPVPEPSLAAMLLLGLAGVALGSRRRAGAGARAAA